MKCPRCGCVNSQERKFCGTCGEELVLRCPRCGFENALQDSFCGGCGRDFGAVPGPSPLDALSSRPYTPKFLSDEILKTRSAVEGERKVVTVLFADVADFTALSGRLGPEKVHEIMDGCFKLLAHEIHGYEGTINQFTGDGIMALFGAPLAHEDHAIRACRAALAIQQGLEAYGAKMRQAHAVDFRMRLGLSSGPVVVGAIGDHLRMDYTAMGDTTNLAFRVQSLAEAGTTCVSGETYRLARGMFLFEALEAKTIKGKTGTVPIYRLLSLKPEAHRPRLGSERTIYSRMVGRDQELEKLELQVLKAVNGQGSIVNIVGEAGIGKSRLVTELKGRETMGRVGLLEGRSISFGKNLSYHPIIDLLRQWTAVREEEDAEGALDKLTHAVRGIAPREAGEIVPFIGTLMGIPLWGEYAERVRGLEGPALERLILKSLRDLLVRGAEQTPLAIVMEDLHWADTSSVDMLESLFRLAETQRILFLNVFRPGFPDTGDRIRKALRERPSVYSLEILLEPLDEQASEALIGSMLTT